MTDPLLPTWFDALSDPATYPHAVSDIQFAETHISWVVLTGEWAYKLKKPVNFGFVDFTTLEKRRIACQDEVRLNQRTASDLYDCVVPLTDEPTGPRFAGTGPVLEYAVRMRQFVSEDTFDHIQERGELSADLVESLARNVADLHQQAEIATRESPFGDPSSIFKVVDDCFRALEKTTFPRGGRNALHKLNEWFQATWKRLQTTFAARKRDGYVRECHGDLHLGNVVLYAGKPTLFDCLEFNAGLRWIDTASDIAFLVMDLHDRGAPSLGWRALNEWLQQTGDYGALLVLKYYLVYRALVRAKVANLRLHQPGLVPSDRRQQKAQLRSYLELASVLSRPSRPAIVLMHGLSGSGKSFVARNLATTMGAIQIRSDVERKRLFGAWPETLSNPTATAEMYSTAVTERTYLHLQSLVRDVIFARYPVIVDAAFLKQPQRQQFVKLADELNVPFAIITCHAPEDVLKDRIRKRQQSGHDASDADLKVLESQISASDPITDWESKHRISIDTTISSIETLDHLVAELDVHNRVQLACEDAVPRRSEYKLQGKSFDENNL